MTIAAPIGHNNPPDPIDEAVAPFLDVIEETTNWLDGEPVTTEPQMKSVDALLKRLKAAKKEVGEAEKAACLPLHDAWKGEKARWKPTLDDLDMRAKGLVAITDVFKRELARKREDERRAADAEARRKAKDAEFAAKAAAKAQGDIEAQYAAAEAAKAAIEARAGAKKIEAVKGMRTVWHYEVDDYRAFINWLATNQKDALRDFADEWLRKNHREFRPDGTRVWDEKEAY